MGKRTLRIQRSLTFHPDTLDKIEQLGDSLNLSPAFAIDVIVSEWEEMSSRNSSLAMEQTKRLDGLEKTVISLEDANKRLVDINERILIHLRLLNANLKETEPNLSTDCPLSPQLTATTDK